MDDSFTVINESKLEDFEALIKKLQNPEGSLLLCPETSKRADIILLDSKPGEQVLYCVRCLVTNPDIVGKHRHDLIPVDDFLEKCQEIIDNKKTKSEGISFDRATELIQLITNQAKDRLIKQVESAFQASIEKASGDFKTYISSSVFESPQEQDKEELKGLKGMENYPNNIQELVHFFIVNKIDRKFLLKDTLEACLQDFTLKKNEQDRIDSIVRGVLSSMFAELMYLNKSIKRFNPTTDITCRNFQIQPLYTYSGNGSLSMCFMVSRAAYFHGFSNFLGQVNTPVEYTISVGEAKNLNQVLKVIQTTLKVNADAVVVSERQSANSSAEVFDSPLPLQENVWYNICMNPRTNGANFNIYWGTGVNNTGTNLFKDRRECGLEITLKSGTDDNCGNSTYATIFPDFFIS